MVNDPIGDMLIQINVDYFDNFDDDIKTILIEQELNRIECRISQLFHRERLMCALSLSD